MHASRPLKLTVKVTNTGNRAGKEAVILYVNDAYASVSRPNKQVKGVQKIYLEPQESKEIEFELNVEDLKFTNQQNKRVYESGYFNVYIADQKARFYLKDSTPLTSTPLTSTPTTTKSLKTTTPSTATSLKNDFNLIKKLTFMFAFISVVFFLLRF
jgi:hypothetical protein